MLFSSHGKVMITGEYLVLAGARALAMPVRFGQSLQVTNLQEDTAVLYWKSLVKGKHWLDIRFSGDELTPSANSTTESDLKAVGFVRQVLLEAKKLSPGFLSGEMATEVITNIDFDLSWGLGSSSSLISNVAYWAGADPYDLFFQLSKGSGYDIACARSNTPIVYKYNGHFKQPDVRQVSFRPGFHEQLFFIHSGQKQDSAESIAQFDISLVTEKYIRTISRITDYVVHAKDVNDFVELMTLHESVTAKATGLQPVQEKYFSGFPGVVKSLGAWGGDFLLAAADIPPADIKSYFQKKNAKVIIPFQDMELAPSNE